MCRAGDLKASRLHYNSTFLIIQRRNENIGVPIIYQRNNKTVLRHRVKLIEGIAIDRLDMTTDNTPEAISSVFMTGKVYSLDVSPLELHNPQSQR